jgi:hypothetical protein
MGPQDHSALNDYDILLTAHSEKLDQVLKSLLDIRGSLDVKKQNPSKMTNDINNRYRYRFLHIVSTCTSMGGQRLSLLNKIVEAGLRTAAASPILLLLVQASARDAVSLV